MLVYLYIYEALFLPQDTISELGIDIENPFSGMAFIWCKKRALRKYIKFIKILQNF